MPLPDKLANLYPDIDLHKPLRHYTDRSILLWIPHSHAFDEYKLSSFQVTQAMLRLQTSLNGVQNGLLRMLPSLFNNQSIKTTAFPTLTMPGMGTMVIPSPVAAYSKLTKTKNDYPTFGSLRHSLPQDLVTGNSDGLLKKINQLQDAGQPVFSELFYHLSRHWEVISELYQEKYHITLPPLELFKDKSGYYDSEKFSAFFFDLAFLNQCMVHLLLESSPFYGLALELVLKGKLDLLKSIALNEKLHPFDEYSLHFILPGMLISALKGISSDFDQSHNAYFKGVVNFLSLPELITDQQVTELTKLYQHMNTLYYFSVASSVSTQEAPKIGDPCSVHFYMIHPLLDIEQEQRALAISEGRFDFLQENQRGIRTNFQASEDNSTEIMIGPPAEIPEPILLSQNELSELLIKYSHAGVCDISYARQGNYQLRPYDRASQTPVLDAALLNPILGYFMGLLIQVPQAKLAAKASVIGPVLRSIFPYTRLDLLTLPLSDSMRELATALFQTPAASALPQTLQSYHLPQILPPETLKTGEVQLLPEGFLNLGSGLASGKIYQGSHDVFHVVPLTKSSKKSAHAIIKDTYDKWHHVFGLKEQTHPVYGAIEEAPYSDSSLPDANVHLHLTPNTVSVKQDKSDLVYYPVAMRDKGLYVSLSEGPDLKGKVHGATQNIASGCCLLGNDFVGHCETEEGIKAYCLLDAHQEPPQGNVVDVSFNFPEHPEETMYLALQKTLGPFFRDTHPGQQVNFYYHDLRKAYLFYLLPHYLRGTMSREVLLKGAAIIDARHELMVGKLKEIMSASQIQCESFSSLEVLETQVLLNQIDALRDSPLDNQAKEALLVKDILRFMASDPRVPESTKRVYNHVLTQEKLIEELTEQSGLHTIAILGCMVQFAILNQNSDSPLLVALPSVEYKLLKNYEAYFGKVFGSVVHFLWMNPVNLRDDSKHNRLFFVGDHIPEYHQLLEDTLEPVQELIKHQALDEPEGVVANVKNISAKIANLPHFFTKIKVTESKAVPGEALAKKPDSPKV
jgi:hypothetical protein